MRTICVTVTFLFLAGPATAAELTEVWRVQGLSNAKICAIRSGREDHLRVECRRRSRRQGRQGIRRPTLY